MAQSVTPIKDWTKTVIAQSSGKNWNAYNADCVPFTMGLPDNSIHMSVFSPPFSSLYIYSESAADMGNVRDDAAFFEQYDVLASELFRVTKPGRMCAIHVKDLVYYQNEGRNGKNTAGLRDFSGDCIRSHVRGGWDFHCRITIWRDPVKEMQKTKAHGLLWKTLRADSTFSRVGNPEYLLIFRKWAKEGEEAEPVTHTKQSFPVDQWQQWASPVWMDTRETDVLNAKIARDSKDEKHLCPMPLDITTRAISMWSNPGDIVFSPFMGVGSEGYAALKNGRKFIGTELHPNYYGQACKYLDEADRSSGTLLDLLRVTA
jgi:hypothetical protein